MKGIISEWNDSKGYGFIRTRGSNRIFLHISAVANGEPRPALNVFVRFETERDSRGRLTARRVRMVQPVPLPLLFGGSYMTFVCASVLLLGRSWLLIPGYLGCSLLTYVVYARDKQAARKGLRRTPEKTLHFLSLAGGWPGALVAQHHLRHKSRKQPFKTLLWLTIAINSSCFVGIFTPLGSDLLSRITGYLH